MESSSKVHANVPGEGGRGKKQEEEEEVEGDRERERNFPYFLSVSALLS